MDFEDDEPTDDAGLQRREVVLQMSSDPEVIDFLEACASGLPKYHAGASVGWSPAQVDRRLKDPSFRTLYDGAENLALDGVELAMIQKARNGHVAAAQFVLTNLRPDRWAEKRQLEVTTNVGVNAADKASIMEGVRGIMADAENRRSAIEALQAGAIEAHSEKAS